MLRPHAACRAARGGAGGAARRGVPPHAAPHARPALPPCRARRNARAAGDVSTRAADSASDGAASADEQLAPQPAPQPQPSMPTAQPRRRDSQLRDSQLRRGGVICTSGVVLGTQRNRAAKGIRAGGVVYVEGDDGSLEALTANDVRGSFEKMVRGLVAPQHALCGLLRTCPARSLARSTPRRPHERAGLIWPPWRVRPRVCAAERHQQPAAARGRRRRRVARLLVRALRSAPTPHSKHYAANPSHGAHAHARAHTHARQRRSFTKFNFIRTIVSSCGAVLGTRALLRAIGVGGASAAMGSAALNWVLKDGLGRCGAIAAASVIGNKFDNDSKTYFLLGDVRRRSRTLLPLRHHLVSVRSDAYACIWACAWAVVPLTRLRCVMSWASASSCVRRCARAGSCWWARWPTR
jgi:hypothetical protein